MNIFVPLRSLDHSTDYHPNELHKPSDLQSADLRYLGVFKARITENSKIRLIFLFLGSKFLPPPFFEKKESGPILEKR
jgi:hypothetical protein